jgi:hypothetical protein
LNYNQIVSKVKDKSSIFVDEATSGEQLFAMPPIAMSRIVFILTRLSVSNSSFIYLILKSRNSDKKLLDDNENSKIVFLKNDLFLNNLNSKSITNQSTNSLFESIILLLSNPNFSLDSSSSVDLESLTQLISIITEPLDNIIDDSNSIDSCAKEIVISDELRAKDEKLGVVSVLVPRVILKKECLGHLCDTLLSDACNRKIFINITSAISRLAKINENNLILLELLFDVIIDLSQQSQKKLEYLLSCLLKIKSSNLFQENEKKTKSLSRISASLLPCGESGGRQHDR